jgi:hypothetical protein
LICVCAFVTACTRENSAFCNDDDDCGDNVSCDTVRHECMSVDGGADPADAFTCTVNGMCVEDNARFCDDTAGTCRGCEDRDDSSEECSGLSEGTDFCSSGGECVECLDNAACMTAESPTCDAFDLECRPCGGNDDCIGASGGEKCTQGGACVECVAHGDCASEVCDPDTTTCAAAAAILYVGGTSATNNSSCGTSVLPCASITFGLGEIEVMHTYMAVRPESYLENIDISGMTLKIIGPGASIVSLNDDTPVFEVSGGANIVVDGLTLRSAVENNGGAPDGIRCLDSSTVLTVRNAEIHNNDRRGISAGSCTVTVIGSNIHDNQDYGVYALGTELTVTDSEIEGNENGGIRLQSAAFRLINNYIIDNGASNAQTGGVSIENASGLMFQEFLFNTVAGNQSDSNQPASGVRCDVDNGSNPTVVGNIVYDNTGASNQTSGNNCSWEYSNIEDVLAAGTNISALPQFLGANSGNYHIGGTSPCIDQVMTTTGIEFDFDGERRDGLPDIGADEIVD